MKLKNNEITESGTRWECLNCKHLNTMEADFCIQCGNPRFSFSSEFGKKSVYSVLALYLMLLLAILVIYLFEPGGNGWMGQFFGSLILASVTLFFVGVDFTDFRRYIFPDTFRWKLFLIILIFSPVFSFCVSNGVSWLNQTLYDQNIRYINSYFDAPYPFLFAVILTAVFPAVFEELAFRGVVFSRGRGLFTLKQTIVVSSVLFTFLHLSLLSFFWIFPFALVLGWMRARYRTVFYGMIVHFLHNLTAIVLENFSLDNLL